MLIIPVSVEYWSPAQHSLVQTILPTSDAFLQRMDHLLVRSMQTFAFDGHLDFNWIVNFFSLLSLWRHLEEGILASALTVADSIYFINWFFRTPFKNFKSDLTSTLNNLPDVDATWDEYGVRTSWYLVSYSDKLFGLPITLICRWSLMQVISRQ